MVCYKILFLFVMTHNKEYTHNNERKSNEQDDAEAHPNGMVHFVIMNKDKGAKYESDKYENDTSNKFQFPGYNQKGCQNIRRNKMD